MSDDFKEDSIMTDSLRCQICGELVENTMCFLHDHIKSHIHNYEKEAKRDGKDIDVWVLSHFDSVSPTLSQSFILS